MYLAEIIVIAIGLSMDSFAVSLASGMCKKPLPSTLVFRTVILLGIFQALFASLGWLLGHSFQYLMDGIDHWLAFVLLGAIGTKMIWESLKNGKSSQTFDITNWLILLGLSVATSIDALIVGLSLGMLETSIFESALVIGGVTMLFSLSGFWIAQKLGIRVMGKKAELMGGAVLIMIGIKVLYEHLI